MFDMSLRAFLFQLSYRDRQSTWDFQHYMHFHIYPLGDYCYCSRIRRYVSISEFYYFSLNSLTLASLQHFLNDCICLSAFICNCLCISTFFLLYSDYFLILKTSLPYLPDALWDFFWPDFLVVLLCFQPAYLCHLCGNEDSIFQVIHNNDMGRYSRCSPLPFPFRNL